MYRVIGVDRDQTRPTVLIQEFRTVIPRVVLGVRQRTREMTTSDFMECVYSENSQCFGLTIMGTFGEKDNRSECFGACCSRCHAGILRRCPPDMVLRCNFLWFHCKEVALPTSNPVRCTEHKGWLPCSPWTQCSPSTLRLSFPR